MFSLSTLSLALSLSDYVRGASVPTPRQYDELDSEGIMGDEVVRTPGKLRVTENSGICGTFFRSMYCRLYHGFSPCVVMQRLHPV